MAKASSRKRVGINRFFKMSTGAVELMGKSKEERDITVYVKKNPKHGFSFVARSSKTSIASEKKPQIYLNNLYMNINRFNEQGLPAVIALAKAYIEAEKRGALSDKFHIHDIKGTEIGEMAKQILSNALKNSNETIFNSMEKYTKYPEKYKAQMKEESKMLDELRRKLGVTIG